MRRGVITAIALGLGTAAAAPPALDGIGRTPTAAEVSALDISISPDGTGLPAGRGSSKDGAVLFQALCAACHGARGEGVANFPALVGGRDSLASDKPTLTIGSYWPYATTVWDYTRRAMPYYTPGVLTPDQIYALTAFILQMNGIVEPDTVLTERTLAMVRMPNRDGFVADPRPEVFSRAR
jgi:cytochrome c